MLKKESAEQGNQPKEVPFDLDRHYTPQDIMRILNKSDTTIYGYLRKRQLKSYRFGREFIITASQLNEFAEGRRLNNMLVSGAVVEVPFADLSDADLSTAMILRSALDELGKHDPKVFEGLRNFVDIQDLPQVKFPLPDLDLD